MMRHQIPNRVERSVLRRYRVVGSPLLVRVRRSFGETLDLNTRIQLHFFFLNQSLADHGY